ncbi:MAG: hypothetical protein L0027_02710 [Candidatus Rokubacteria bacterium]|nr:hypothetical protein [Candidatus Rokubacteria bacterium]
MKTTLAETFQLLGRHLDLFTLIALTVWLPGHVAANYVQHFGPRGDGPAPSVALILMTELAFGPLVAASTIAALDRITRGMPVDYWTALHAGALAWGRLFVVRFVTGLIIVAGFLVLILPGLVLLVRYALVDAVAVLEGGNAADARRRSGDVTAGQRWEIFWTGTVLFAIVLGLNGFLATLVRVIPPLDHFVVRVLVDCVLAVAQTIFTIALFLFYRRGAARVPAAA